MEMLTKRTVSPFMQHLCDRLNRRLARTDITYCLNLHYEGQDRLFIGGVLTPFGIDCGTSNYEDINILECCSFGSNEDQIFSDALKSLAPLL